MNFSRAIFCAVFAFATLEARTVLAADTNDVSAQATNASSNSQSIPGGTNISGTRGTNRVESAAPLPGGGFVFNTGASFSNTTDLFGDGGANRRVSQSLVVVWSPLDVLDVFASQNIVSNSNDVSPKRTTQTLGDPTLGFKVGNEFGDHLFLGARVATIVPTSAAGTGLNPAALIVDGRLLFSAILGSTHLSANAGYRYDNSRSVFKRDDAGLTAAQRFTANISELDLATFGLSVEHELEATRNVLLNPFVEVFGGVPLGAEATTELPLLASAGLKVLPVGRDSVEISVGADLRLSGAPDPIAQELPGLPPWEVFGRLAVHFSGAKPAQSAPPATAASPACTSASDCGAGMTCLDNACVREITKTVTKEVVRDRPQFRIRGSVVDQSSGQPVGSATVSFSGEDGSPIAVDYRTGEFLSYGLNSGEGIVQVTVDAPGYRSTSKQLQNGKDGETLEFVVKLQPLGVAAKGEIKGSLKDGRSGKPLRGRVFIPVLDQKVRAGANGEFRESVKAGRYQVLISARGYITQKKEIEIRAGDVVILNVDLVPR